MKAKRQNSQQVPVPVLSQGYYLKEFDALNGNLHKKSWAQSFISKFYVSINFSVFQCTVCYEAWPLKSNTKSPDTYICSQCSMDKKFKKSFR